jgi:hypothetical protein
LMCFLVAAFASTAVTAMLRPRERCALRTVLHDRSATRQASMEAQTGRVHLLPHVHRCLHDEALTACVRAQSVHVVYLRSRL